MIRICSISVAALLTLWCGPGQAQTAPHYIPLKKIADERFPVRETDLLTIRDEQNVAEMRKHAWRLFAGLTGTGSPIWNSWFTKCDVRLMACREIPQGKKNDRRRMLQALDVPLQDFVSLLPTRSNLIGREHLESFDGRSQMDAVSDQAIDDLIKKVQTPPHLAHVLYNLPAARNILKYKLFAGGSLDEILAARRSLHSNLVESEIPPFPNDSIALKLDWDWTLQDPSNRRYTFPIEGMMARNPVGHGAPTTYSIRLDISKKVCDGRDYDPPADGKPADVPIGCVYFLKIGPDDDIDWSLLKLDPPSARVPVYLVLRAVHVSTKEISDWVWATFWWNSHPSNSSYACDEFCRKILPNAKWRHFLMDVTLSEKTPLEIDGGRKVCYNPFLEASHPDSNCIQCHRRAAYLPEGPKAKRDCGYEIGGAPRCDESGTGHLPSCPTPVVACGHPLEDYFQNTLQTDFLWTIPTAQIIESDDAARTLEKIREHFASFLNQQFK